MIKIRLLIWCLIVLTEEVEVLWNLFGPEWNLFKNLILLQGNRLIVFIVILKFLDV